jgi:hypothetical protein
MLVTVALVPVKLIVCGLPVLFTVSVAVSAVPAGWLGVNRNTMVQLNPLLSSKPFEQLPEAVPEKSPAFAPLMLK